MNKINSAEPMLLTRLRQAKEEERAAQAAEEDNLFPTSGDRKASDLGRLPASFWTYSTFTRQILTVAEDYRTSPEMLLMTVLILVSAATHPTVRVTSPGYSPVSLNVQGYADGDSGDGKSIAVEDLAPAMVPISHIVDRDGENLDVEKADLPPVYHGDTMDNTPVEVSLSTAEGLIKRMRSTVITGDEEAERIIHTTRGYAFCDEAEQFKAELERKGSIVGGIMNTVWFGNKTIAKDNANSDHGRIHGKLYRFSWAVLAQPEFRSILLGQTHGQVQRFMFVPASSPFEENVTGLPDLDEIGLEDPEALEAALRGVPVEHTGTRKPDALMVDGRQALVEWLASLRYLTLPLDVPTVRLITTVKRTIGKRKERGTASKMDHHEVVWMLKVMALLALADGRTEVAFADAVAARQFWKASSELRNHLFASALEEQRKKQEADREQAALRAAAVEEARARRMEDLPGVLKEMAAYLAMSLKAKPGPLERKRARDRLRDARGSDLLDAAQKAGIKRPVDRAVRYAVDNGWLALTESGDLIAGETPNQN